MQACNNRSETRDTRMNESLLWTMTVGQRYQGDKRNKRISAGCSTNARMEITCYDEGLILIWLQITQHTRLHACAPTLRDIAFVNVNLNSTLFSHSSHRATSYPRGCLAIHCRVGNCSQVTGFGTKFIQLPFRCQWGTIPSTISRCSTLRISCATSFSSVSVSFRESSLFRSGAPNRHFTMGLTVSEIERI